jgi:hypothetical protein
MGFRLRRFRRTVASTTRTVNCQEFPALAQHSWHMSSERHLVEFAGVHAANLGALMLSLTEAEQWIRVAGLFLAAVYTLAKIIEVCRNLRK